MKITILPFRSVLAFTDVESREIFVNQSVPLGPDCVQNLKHEFAHIVSGSPDHDHRFNDCLVNQFDGEPVAGPDLFSKWRKRAGIPLRISSNIGNISGIQNMLVDYHLLQSYRKFSQRTLGTEGHWEVLGEGGDGPGQQLIRLYPTPKGVFPVVVLYYPVVTYFRSPQARKLANDMLLAEAKIMLGHARRKIVGMPSPTGGNVGMDGGDLIAEGTKMKEDITKQAIEYGEPLMISLW